MKEILQNSWLYLNRHWFKFGVIGILLYAFFSKDLSFKIELQAPDEAHPPAVEEQALPAPAVRRSTLTDNRLLSERKSVTDRLKLFWSGGAEEDVDMPMIRILSQVPESEIKSFLHRFIPVAEDEQKKYGIPASIILANALLFSAGGESGLSREGHNYFALPCTPDWQGETGRHNGQCYRYYENAWMSFRDHSLYLTTGAMARLRSLGADDYRAWAKALEAANYGAMPQLAAQLIKVIEAYDLSVHD